MSTNLKRLFTTGECDTCSPSENSHNAGRARPGPILRLSNVSIRGLGCCKYATQKRYVSGNQAQVSRKGLIRNQGDMYGRVFNGCYRSAGRIQQSPGWSEATHHPGSFFRSIPFQSIPYLLPYFLPECTDRSTPVNMETFNASSLPAMASYTHLIQYLPQVSTLEKLWEAHYAYWDNDIIATGIIAFIAHELIYFGRCLPWIIADALPSIFRRYRIQDHKSPPTVSDQWTCTKYILLIHFVIELPLIVLFHPMMDLCSLQYSLPFPTLKSLALQIALFFLVEDTYHYWLHRAFHWGPLYRRIHRIHHQYAAPFGLTAEYASPWETLLLGFGTIGPPLVLGAVTKNVHLVTVLVWMTLRQVQAIDAHSGYDFPWSLRRIIPFWGGADWHDDHHRYFVGNYSSSFKHWDVLMGTVAGPKGREKKKK